MFTQMLLWLLIAMLVGVVFGLIIGTFIAASLVRRDYHHFQAAQAPTLRIKRQKPTRYLDDDDYYSRHR